MLALVALVGSIAIVDSVNPSTLVPALWLAAAPRGRGLASYTLGVFLVYLAGGLLLVFGPGPALISSLHHVRGPLEHALQAAGGIVAVAFAAALWRARPREGEARRPRRSYTPASAFALGSGIMAIELPTAFMYFGAISAIIAERPAAIAKILLLVAYNAVFVMPVLALLAVHRLARDRVERWLDRAEVRLRRFANAALTGLAGAGGTALLVLGVGGLLAG
jgi:cytochrome c biogenesis protein CcdA